MAINRYFDNFPSQTRINNEHALMEDVIEESIQIMGHDCYYILRESIDSIDYLFGEEPKVKLKYAYMIEAYIANVEGFEGQGDFFTKFGLEIRDTTNLILSRRSFSRVVPTSLRQRPQEGDLLYVPLMNRIFEIKFIEKKLTFFSLGNRNPFIYECRCEDFRYSQEKMETGITPIDRVEEDNSYTMRLQLSTTGVGDYEAGETVYQNANNSAKVSEWYKANGSMLIYGITGTFTPSANLYGMSSHAVYPVISIDDNKIDYVKQDLYDNSTANTEASVILDLSEINLFGAP